MITLLLFCHQDRRACQWGAGVESVFLALSKGADAVEGDGHLCAGILQTEYKVTGPHVHDHICLLEAISSSKLESANAQQCLTMALMNAS